MVDWFNKKGKLQGKCLEAWKQRIRDLQDSFDDLNRMHISREFNTYVDVLSKDAFIMEEGSL